MSIFRQHSLALLAKELGILGDSGGGLAFASITEARARLGARPLQKLFKELPMPWGAAETGGIAFPSTPWMARR